MKTEGKDFYHKKIILAALLVLGFLVSSKLAAETTTPLIHIVATQESVAATDGFHSAGEDISRTRNYIAIKSEEKARWAIYGGPMGYVYYFAKTLLPFESAWAKYDAQAEGWDPGTNMQQQIQNMWLMAPQHRVAWIDKRYSDIAATNPIDANDWLNSLDGYSSFAQVESNVIFILKISVWVIFCLFVFFKVKKLEL